MTDGFVLVLTTAPDEHTAATLADTIVRDRLAACVNVLPAMRSFYRWQGAVQNEQEHQLLIKTRYGLVEPLQAHIKASHPYELPEIIAVPVVAGLSGYLDWIAAETERTQ